MKNFKKIACLLLAVITVMGAFSGCSKEAPKEVNIKEIKFNEEQTAQTEKSIDNILTEKKFSGTAYANLNNQELYFKSFGYKEPENKKKIKNNQKYELGSVSKIFTGLAIMKLEEDKKIKLTDKLSKYFTGQKYLNKITIKDLLEMKSGFGSYLEDITKDEKFYKKIEKMVNKNPNNYKVTYMIRDRIIANGLKYDIGDYHFSDSGYFLLGIIVSQFSDKGYCDYVEKNIIKPLKLKNTMFVSPIYNNLWGYSEKTKKWLLPASIPTLNDYQVMYSSMGVISSIDDLNTIIDTILNSNKLKKIFNTDSKFNYGFYIDGSTVYAEGSTTLHSAYVSVDTEPLIKTIVLSNHTGIEDFDIMGNSINNAINSKINGMLLENA